MSDTPRTGCTAPRYFMCRRHWRMVPAHLQDAIWLHYRLGQERDKHPSMAYLNVAREARQAVRELESAS